MFDTRVGSDQWRLCRLLSRSDGSHALRWTVSYGSDRCYEMQCWKKKTVVAGNILGYYAVVLARPKKEACLTNARIGGGCSKSSNKHSCSGSHIL